MSPKADLLVRAVSGRSRSGFTLIEMLVVLAIIGTLAMLVGPAVFRNVGDANVIAARSQVDALTVALESMRLDSRAYPSTAQGLKSLHERPAETMPGWRGPYLRKNAPLDPWGRPYVYVCPGVRNPDSFDLYSLGRDGAPGGTGEDEDITSWGGAVNP